MQTVGTRTQRRLMALTLTVIVASVAAGVIAAQLLL